MGQIDPVLLFFVLGVVAGLLRTPLRVPAQAHDLVSMVLLLAIGLKGGVEIAGKPLGTLLPHALAVAAMGGVLTLLAFPLLRWPGKLSRADAGSVAAHYGSVSVATFAVASAWFAARGIFVEGHMPFLLAVLEVPAIVVGIALARGLSRQANLGEAAREVLLGKGIVLLVGGILIGWAAGPEGAAPLKPLFFDLFKGILAVFLLEMGLVTASQLGGLRRHGLFLVLFGIGMPLVSSLVGIGLGAALGYSVGGAAMLGTLAASASYIAVPAAMRVSVPEADPVLPLAASLGITFPFNVVVGIPLYHGMAQRLLGAG